MYTSSRIYVSSHILIPRFPILTYKQRHGEREDNILNTGESSVAWTSCGCIR